MPDAGVLATILLIVGLLLIALELMIPSFGMIGILAAICMLISAWCAWQAWWADSPGFFWTYVAFWVLGIPAVMGGMLYLIQNSALGNHIVLKAPEPKGPLKSRAAGLVGRVGRTSSALMPGGMVVIDDGRHHAESTGMMIESGQPVEVIAVKSNRVVVKLSTEEALEASQLAAKDSSLAETMVASSGQEMPTEGSPESSPLDFEIPES